MVNPKEDGSLKAGLHLARKASRLGLGGNLAAAGTASYLNFFILVFLRGKAIFFSELELWR
jgi:hypothetical protein